MIQKSIDRLESVLYIRPDDGEAAFTLAFCHSLHEPECYDPDRADRLLRSVYQRDPESELAAYALMLLPQIAYHDRLGRLDKAQKAQTIDRLWLAIKGVPPKYHGHYWNWLLWLLNEQLSPPQDAQALADLLAFAVPFAENPGEASRESVAGQVGRIALGLSLQETRRYFGPKGLNCWTAGPPARTSC